jgi:hypothetical protein
MKKYWINKCIVTPEGELMPQGFELHVGESTAKIVVPSDLYGDTNLLYEEEISLKQEVFKATYQDGNPVHVDDGEVIGMDLDEYRSQF